MMQQLSTIPFQKDFISQFPGDESGIRTPRQTPGKLWSKAQPTPVQEVKLLAWSDDLAKELEIERPASQQEVDILGGNFLTPSMFPYAACYAGHQFGNWAGQLGDGRAITLGERVASGGQKWELQWKGAGPTAYSRRADGRAVLRSSVREYLMSEAMHYLGIPTTRALSLVSTGDKVLRDMFYDGHPAHEQGAIVLRVAPTFIRFGSFEMPAVRGELQNLRKLVDWTIQQYYPYITGEDNILIWYKEIVERTARLMVEWMRVGFVHGVMNTDNMSILGLTIDYGPYSFVDNYDHSFTPNTTDLPGRRYAFGKQAAVAKWNLGCLGGALTPLFPNTDELVKIIDTYDDYYWQQYYRMMGNKLGLDTVAKDDVVLINDLEKMLQAIQPDMTIFFQQLMELPEGQKTAEEQLAHFKESLYDDPQPQELENLSAWLDRYQNRLQQNAVPRKESYNMMQQANPRFILRNYLLHQAIEELQNGSEKLFVKLQQAMKEPYKNVFPEFFAKRPSWATQKAGCSMLSCSS